MAGIQDLIQSYAYGGPVRRYAAGDVVSSTPPQPAFSSDPTINAAWNALAGKTGADITAQRQALAQQNEAYQTNQNLGGLYNLNQNNANTFLKDASVGLTPLTTGQNPNTQTYTPDAWKTMLGFEQALSAGNNQPTLAGRQNAANALMQEFQGTGSNPLLGQYNQLSGTPATATTPATQGAILPWQNGAPGVGTAGTPAYVPPAPVGNTGASVVNTGTTTGTTGTSTSSGGNNVFTLLKGQVLPIGAKFDSTKVPVNGTSYTDESGFLHEQTTAGDYTINPITKVIVSYTPYHAKGGSVGMPQEYSRGNWKLI
jgi:hypothetical protein